MDKHPAFIVRQDKPLNGGSPIAMLCDFPVTPNDLFFVRNHGAIPSIDAAAYRLHVGGHVRVPLELSLAALKAFPRHEITAVLQCAGNRRHELIRVGAIPDEILWDTEGVSSAVWTGALLRDVLTAAGITGGQHIAFEGLDTISGKSEVFGGSIPLEKAGDVLLAYHMNGEPLPPAHGFPVRAVVPGYIGARSVKWLARITVQDTPSDNYYQAHAYKLFPPYARPESADWDNAPMLGELPINALIGTPSEGDTLKAGSITVRGLAWVGGGRSVERVDISTDGGSTWQQADLAESGGRWHWRQWSAPVTLAAGEYELIARAWDSAANSQPERVESVWNFKGYMNNACHRVKIHVTE